MFSIRTATMADVDLLTTIEAESFPPEEKATRESFEKRLAVFADDFLILEADGKAVGLIDGMITGKDTLEMAVFMTIGQENLRVNLKLKYIGSRWMCIYADLG